MSAWEIIVLVAIVGLAVFGIVWSVRRNKKRADATAAASVRGVQAAPPPEKSRTIKNKSGIRSVFQVTAAERLL
mgnify:CR=1 FL=1